MTPTATAARQHLAAEEATYARVRATLGPEGMDYWHRRLFAARSQHDLAIRADLKAAEHRGTQQEARQPARKPADMGKPRTGTKTRQNANQSERRISVRGKGAK